MNDEAIEALERIAKALERQVEQVDEQVRRNQQMRRENIERADRHDKEREEELEAVRALNQTLIGQMDQALELAHARAAVEQALAADAVDPAATNKAERSTRV